MKPLLIGGPTASGKSGLAIAIAQRFDAVVLSADAMQVYRGLDIGTGKATPNERDSVPHFGLDLRDPHEPFDVADFLALAGQVLAEHPRVVVAGGTSLYLRALVRGLVETPAVDPTLRTELEATEDLHALLAEVDPVLAERLHPNDRIRLVRGIEVFRQTGERLSDLQAAHARAPDRIEVEALWLDRPDLYERIDARVHRMIDDGYVNEVRGLLESGIARGCKPMLSLGYRHLCAHVLDGVVLEDAIRLTQRDTRRFARKQRTWRNALGWEPVTEDALQVGLQRAKAAFG